MTAIEDDYAGRGTGSRERSGNDVILSLFREWKALRLACDALPTDTDDKPMLKANLDRQVEIENEMAAIPAITVGSLAIKFFIINELGYLDSDLIPLGISAVGDAARIASLPPDCEVGCDMAPLRRGFSVWTRSVWRWRGC